MERAAPRPGLDLSRRAFLEAFGWSLFAFLGALPYLFWQLRDPAALPRLLRERLLAGGEALPTLLLRQLLLLALLLFICSWLAGLFRRRYGLPGWGLLELRAWLGRRRNALLAVGFLALVPALHLAGYLLYERETVRLLPELYPSAAGAALLKAWMNTVTFATVGRLGLLTVGCGIVRRKGAANLLVALFFCFLLVQTLQRYGLLPLADERLALALLATLVSQLLLNWIYLKSGFALSLLAQFALELKFVTYALLLRG